MAHAERGRKRSFFITPKPIRGLHRSAALVPRRFSVAHVCKQLTLRRGLRRRGRGILLLRSLLLKELGNALVSFVPVRVEHLCHVFSRAAGGKRLTRQTRNDATFAT